jgi:hypothetical protein
MPKEPPKIALHIMWVSIKSTKTHKQKSRTPNKGQKLGSKKANVKVSVALSKNS